MSIMLVVKHRQTQLPAYRQQAAGEAKQQGGNHHDVMIGDDMAQRDVEHGGSKRDPGIELFLEDQRNALTEHIAQDATKDTGDDSRNHGDHGAFAHIEGDLRPDNGEYHQAERVQHQKEAAQVWHDWRKECRQHSGGGNDDYILRMLHPAKRVVTKQDITHRTTAKRGRGGNNNDAKGVHTASTCGQRTGHRFSSDTNQIENM